ncbi:MAG TPA: hypothetical protein VE990_07845 [Acidimicrobiales bacterium]|nr:hypothetical protein [Acidimicrobiales bacterium]
MEKAKPLVASNFRIAPAKAQVGVSHHIEEVPAGPPIAEGQVGGQDEVFVDVAGLGRMAGGDPFGQPGALPSSETVRVASCEGVLSLLPFAHGFEAGRLLVGGQSRPGSTAHLVQVGGDPCFIDHRPGKPRQPRPDP